MNLRPMYDACMRGAGRMICKRADGGDWIIFSLSEAHYFHASTLLWYSYIILFARYAADSNAMQWWSSFQNLQSEDVIPLRRWVEAVIWYWSHSRIKSATSNINLNQIHHVAHLLISCLPAGQWRRSVAFWKALELLWPQVHEGRWSSAQHRCARNRRILGGELRSTGEQHHVNYTYDRSTFFPSTGGCQVLFHY